ncbi:MAG: efflux RND transporter permease subunit [Pseudomonadota bacterium]
MPMASDLSATTSVSFVRSLLAVFANHPVAANLLMVTLLLLGVWALGKLNVQFFPDFEVEVVTVNTVWPGASAEDVEAAVTLPLEQALRTTAQLEKLTSTSSEGISTIRLEFPEGTDMGAATRRVEALVDSVRQLPTEAERPQITHAMRYEQIARLLVSGPDSRDELRPLVRRIERELLDRGISRITLHGLPEEEIAIQVPQAALLNLEMPLREVSQQVAASSQDVPAGSLGQDQIARTLRATSQAQEPADFAALMLPHQGQLIRLGDIATVEQRARPDQVELSYQGKPAVELVLQRAAAADSLASAQILQDWLVEARAEWPPTIQLTVYDERWQLIADRIYLLLKNGLGGLLLVVGILFLFLNGRVAWWVTVGIPVSFMATLAVMYLGGGSINMISLFALIMALGIIVDDAIVVGEDALAHYQAGESAASAAEGGAWRMFAPVMSSSLTTIAAFIPLFAISGFIGKFLGDIPFVIVCVIIASLIESFLILPGHLRHSFTRLHLQTRSRFRQRWDQGFASFRDHTFRRMITWAVQHRLSTLAVAVGLLIVLVGLMLGGRIGFAFFPNVPGNMLVASASFVSGTPSAQVARFMQQMERTLEETDQAFGGELVQVATVALGQGYSSNGRQAQRGDQFGSIVVELPPNDARTVTNAAFLRDWQDRITQPPGLEYLTFSVRQGGHPGQALEIRLTGGQAQQLKQAALALADAIKTIPGTKSVEDDMPFGQPHWVYRLNPLGQSLGLTTEQVAQQLRGALDGYLTQILRVGDEDIEVRVVLPDDERRRLNALEDLYLFLPQGGTIPFLSVVELTTQPGFKALRHVDGQLAATVYADVDKRTANANAIRARLRDTVLPELTATYGIEWDYTGRAEDQRETAGDMQLGAGFALAMIYIVLAWVFGSYTWPLVVMAIIPFGAVGALLGHWWMDVTPTILSMFGVFALSGIVVNDSIILVVFYKQLRAQGMALQEAVIEAGCRRLRAVLLTSLTTIAGLLPLLFETSLQAQFLIPMAVSISFGLAFATFLVLFLVPALLSALEQAQAGYRRLTTG